MRFINYFFYLTINWNPRIAFHMIRHEVRGEKKYGIRSTGADELASLEKKGIDIEHATIYMPAAYDLLEEVFTIYPPKDFAHIIDIGCGKGRALCVAAHFGAKKVTGIDFSKTFCDEAKKNLAITQHKLPALNYTIVNNDAFYYPIPPDADCIFMFNPFDETIMSGVVENIEISLQEKPRKLIVIYFNPLEKRLFLEAGFREIKYSKKLGYLEYSVLSSE